MAHKINILLMMGALAALLTSCGNDMDGYDATGTFEAEEIILSSEATGKMKTFTATDGQQVRQGEVLGHIDTAQLHLAKLQLLSNLEALRLSKPDIALQTASTKEQLANMRAEKERTKRMLESGAATPKQYDDVTSAVSVLENQLSATESSLQKNKASIDAQMASISLQAEQIAGQIERNVITAPIDGTVLARYIREGELAMPGKPLLRLADTEHLYLRAYFTLAQLNNLSLGQKVKVHADFGDNHIREYKGTVVWISDKSEFTPKGIQTKDERANLVYAVRIAVKNDGYIKIGMYGKVTL